MSSACKMSETCGSRSSNRRGRHSRRLSSSSTGKTRNWRRSCASCRKTTPALTRTSANKRPCSRRKFRATRLRFRTLTQVQVKHTTTATPKLSLSCSSKPRCRTSSASSLIFNLLTTKIKLCGRASVNSLRTKKKRTKRTF